MVLGSVAPVNYGTCLLGVLTWIESKHVRPLNRKHQQKMKKTNKVRNSHTTYDAVFIRSHLFI